MEYNQDTRTISNIETLIAPPATVLTIESEVGLQVPRGPTSGRPVGDTGIIRYNEDTGRLEGFISNVWTDLVSNSSIQTDFINISANISLNDLGGVLSIEQGGTGSTTAANALAALGAYPASNPNGYTNNLGTVTSVAATQPAAGLTITGSPITNNGTLTFTLDNDLAAVEGLTGTGYAVRTSADTWTTRTITGTTGRITVTNGTGTAGDTNIDLSTVGTAGTFGSTTQVPVFTTDAYGRVTTVTNNNIAFPVTSVFGRTGAVVALEGDYSLAQLSDVTLTSPTVNQVLQYNGSQWINATLTGTGGLADPGANGIVVRTSLNTTTARTLNGTANEITITNGDGVTGNLTIAIAPNPILPGTEGVVVPTGTTAQRPTTPNNGEIRYNTTTGYTEVWQNGDWYIIGTTRQGTEGIVAVYTGSIPATSGTSTVPYDNTAPTSTEGSQIWTRTITPATAASSFKLNVPFTVDSSTSNRVVIASLFRGTTNIGSALWFATGGGRPNPLVLSVFDSPATTSPVTYSMRVGIGSGGGTWYVNSTSVGNNLGGKLISTYEIFEVV